MNTPKQATTKASTTSKGGKAPRDPSRSREILSVEEMGIYTSSHQIDPWRGQFVQIGWEHCV